MGHFALAGLLLDNLAAAQAARVVNLSSITRKNAHLDFDDLMSRRDYNAARVYGVSKLATTVFGLELARRLRVAGSPVVSVLAHPGLARTNLTPRAWQDRSVLGRFLVNTAMLVVTLPVELGALPQLHAATAPALRGGQFFGPSGFLEMRGRVTEVRPSTEAANPAVGKRLWSVAENLAGVHYL